MHATDTGDVKGSSDSSGPIPKSSSSRVNLSLSSGGCGSIIPKYQSGQKSDSVVEIRKDPIWCGMKSESIPGYYFICSECLHGEVSE